MLQELAEQDAVIANQRVELASLRTRLAAAEAELVTRERQREEFRGMYNAAIKERDAAEAERGLAIDCLGGNTEIPNPVSELHRKLVEHLKHYDEMVGERDRLREVLVRALNDLLDPTITYWGPLVIALKVALAPAPATPEPEKPKEAGRV